MANLSHKQKAFMAIVFSALLSGAISPVTKIGLASVPPFSFSFLRFVCTSILLTPFLFREKIMMQRKDLVSLTFLSLLPVANIAVFVLGVKLTTASIGQMLYSATPLLVAAYSSFLFKEKLSGSKFFYIVVGFIGALLVIFLPIVQAGNVNSGSLYGNILIGIGVVLWSFYLTLSKQYQKRHSPLVITAYLSFLGTIIFFLLSLTEVSLYNAWWAALTLKSYAAILYVGLGTGGGYFLIQYAIKHGGAVYASLTFYLLPIFAFMSSYVLLGEKLTSGLIAGTLLVFLSIYLTSKAK